MEAVRPSETSVNFYESAPHHFAEESTLHCQHLLPKNAAVEA
jgi:hypothetical protein